MSTGPKMSTSSNFGSLNFKFTANRLTISLSLPEIVKEISLKNGGNFFSLLKFNSLFKKNFGLFLVIFNKISSLGE